jgi:hypothetical protein
MLLCPSSFSPLLVCLPVFCFQEKYLDDVMLCSVDGRQKMSYTTWFGPMY